MGVKIDSAPASSASADIGNVDGPASATDNAVSRFDGTTGKLIQNSGVIISDANLLTTTNLIVSGTTATTVPYLNASKQLTSSAVTPTELGYVSGVTSAIQTQLAAKVAGPGTVTDNAIVRFDGTDGVTVQNSTATISDAGSLTSTQFVAGGTIAWTSTYLGIGGNHRFFINSTGDNTKGMFEFTEAGALGITFYSCLLRLISPTADLPGLVIKGAASQTANLKEVRNSSNTLLNYIASDGRIQADAGAGFKRTTTATSYTALLTDYFVGVTSNTSARTITLPAASTLKAGQVLIIKDEAGTANSANNITIARAGADTIDGATSIAITADYGCCRMYSNGSNAYFTF